MDFLIGLGRRLLAMKHWQVFGILILLGIASLLATPDFEYQEHRTPTVGTIFHLIFSIGINLVFNLFLMAGGTYMTYMANRRLGYAYLSYQRFIWAMAIPVVLIYALNYDLLIDIFSNRPMGAETASSLPQKLLPTIILFPLLFGSWMYSFSRLPKAFRVVESGKPAPISEYLGMFVEFCFYFPIMMWVLQPRFNRIVEVEKEMKTV